MIDNLIFGIIWSCILKVMNFLIFRDFSRNFLNFYEFNSIYSELKGIQKKISSANVAVDKTIAPRGNV